MNEYELFDAIGGVDEDLLRRTEQQPTRRLPVRKFFIAAAAVMLLAVAAFASPVIRDWFFPRGLDLYMEGAIFEPDANGFGGGFSGSTYRVKIVKEDAADLPEFIEDFRMPTYFIEHGWTITPTELYQYRPTISTCFFFQPADDKTIGVLFTQETFNAESAWDETREIYFSIYGTVDGEVIEEPVTIGDMEATLYITPPWSAEGVGSDPGRKQIIWTDAEYGYSLEFDYEADLSFIEEVVLSLASVDINGYTVKENENEMVSRVKPIETFFTLGMVPEGYELEHRTWTENNAQEWYQLDPEHYILLSQCVELSFENDGPAFSVEDSLQNLDRTHTAYTAETYTVDGMEVTIIRQSSDAPETMWHQGEYCFSLDFSFDPGLTDQELLEYVRSVQPMEDFTDHLTE